MKIWVLLHKMHTEKRYRGWKFFFDWVFLPLSILGISLIGNPYFPNLSFSSICIAAAFAFFTWWWAYKYFIKEKREQKIEKKYKEYLESQHSSKSEI